MGLKTILITGSNGLLGQTLVKKLKENQEISVIATSKGENRIKQKSGYRYEEMDISDEEDVETIFEKYQPDVVINTAAMTNVDACEEQKDACRKLNIDAVEILLKNCEKHDSHLIQLSTDFVFDGKDGPYDELAVPNPISYYGESKYEAEEIIKNSSIPWSIVRTIIIYGLVDDMSRSNIVLWAKEALEKNQTLNIVNDQFRSPTYVGDLADACISIAEQTATGIFHISGKDIMSISDLVKRVAKFFQLDDSTVKEISSDSLNQAAKRPLKTGFILTKAKKLVDYQPHSFEEGLELLNKQLNK
tara:strand:+ start:593 stop:1501 length:909 start_codon:yes stop_codon:yes gene_type:complete